MPSAKTPTVGSLLREQRHRLASSHTCRDRPAPRARSAAPNRLRNILASTGAWKDSVRVDQTLRQSVTIKINPLGLNVRRIRTANIGPFIPIDPEPPQVVNGLLRRPRFDTRRIDIFDPQHRFANRFFAPTNRPAGTSARCPGAAHRLVTVQVFQHPSEFRVARRPWKGNHVADVAHAGCILHGPFKTKPESGMRNRPVPSQIDVPPILGLVQASFGHPRLQDIQAVLRAGCRQ